MEVVGQDATGGRVLDAPDQLARDAEARGHDAAGVAGVHALGQDLHVQVGDDDAAQRGRAPQLVVVAAARVEAHHEAHLADPPCQRVDVVRQVVAAALLAGLDQDDTARVLAALLAQRADRGQRGEGRVAVVRAAATVELVALAARASTGRGRRASRPSRAACRGGRRAGPCRRPRPGSPLLFSPLVIH